MTREERFEGCSHKPRKPEATRSWQSRIILPQNIQRDCGPASTFVETHGLQNSERINFSCFKLPSLQFVTASIQN